VPGFAGYHMFQTGPNAGGAIGKRGEMAPEKLRLYVVVDTLEEGCAAVEANGGSVVEPPTDIGQGMGRFAVIRDTEGNEMGLWQSVPDAG
jgi:uncharacterized protein